MDCSSLLNIAVIVGLFLHQSEAGTCFIGQVFDISINKAKWGAGFVNSVCECSEVAMGGGITVVKYIEEALQHFWFYEEGDILSLPITGKQPWRQECDDAAGSQNPEAFYESDQCTGVPHTREDSHSSDPHSDGSTTTGDWLEQTSTSLTESGDITEITDEMGTSDETSTIIKEYTRDSPKTTHAMKTTEREPAPTEEPVVNGEDPNRAMTTTEGDPGFDGSKESNSGVTTAGLDPGAESTTGKTTAAAEGVVDKVDKPIFGD